MNIKVIKILASELNYLNIESHLESIFEISFDATGDLIIDWQSRKAKVMIANLAKELGLDYHADFKIGHTRVEDLSFRANSKEKLVIYLQQTLADYIEISELFIK